MRAVKLEGLDERPRLVQVAVRVDRRVVQAVAAVGLPAVLGLQLLEDDIVEEDAPPREHLLAVLVVLGIT